MLAVHIVSAIAGLAGSYLWCAVFLIREEKSGKGYWAGLSLAMLGLAGTTVSGLWLFSADPELFLHSGKFLSNMTILGALVLTELAFFRTANTAVRAAARVISAYSWTWTFTTALLNPPYPYAYFMAAYVIALLFLMAACVRLRLGWFR